MTPMRRESFITAVAMLSVATATVGYAGAKELISGNVLKQFRPVKGWHLVEKVSAAEGQKDLSSTKGKDGLILLNGEKKARVSYLFTAGKFGDVSVSLEFMIPKGSNAGIYLMGRYEIQIFDSYGKDVVKHSDLGGIYQRWGKNSYGKGLGYEGVAPKVNAAKAPGEWQKIDTIFRAPRFDASGKKVQNAKFVSVHVNGQLVHENVEVTGPTRAHPLKGEEASGPVSIQGDHGPIAIRSFVVEPLQ